MFVVVVVIFFLSEVKMCLVIWQGSWMEGSSGDPASLILYLNSFLYEMFPGITEQCSGVMERVVEEPGMC